MGNVVKKGGEVKSSFFGCDGCVGEKNPKTKYSEIIVGQLMEPNPDLNYFKTPDMKITPNDFVRSYSFGNRNDTTINNTNNNNNQLNNWNLKEEDVTKFNADKYELDPNITKLKFLLGENSNFTLTEKESIFIKKIKSQNVITRKLLHFKDGSYYNGYVNLKTNTRELFGKYYYENGSIYEGFFQYDKMKGRGRLYCINNYVYEGEFDENLFNGFGKLYALNGLIYEGNWKNNLQDGYGIEHYSDGSSYSGLYKKGLKNGNGRFTWRNGDCYEGEFYQDEMTGWGMFKWKDGRIYNGTFKKHLMDGVGVFVWNDNKFYIGEYKDELKNGFGIFYTNDGRNYSGYWKLGKQHGPGIVTNIYGQKYYIKYNEGIKASVQLFSPEEKTEIDNKIAEGEKNIDKEKLFKLAHELIMEKEQRLQKEKNNNSKVNKESDVDFRNSYNSNNNLYCVSNFNNTLANKFGNESLELKKIKNSPKDQISEGANITKGHFNIKTFKKNNTKISTYNNFLNHLNTNTFKNMRTLNVKSVGGLNKEKDEISNSIAYCQASIGSGIGNGTFTNDKIINNKQIKDLIEKNNNSFESGIQKNEIGESNPSHFIRMKNPVKKEEVECININNNIRGSNEFQKTDIKTKELCSSNNSELSNANNVADKTQKTNASQ